MNKLTVILIIILIILLIINNYCLCNSINSVNNDRRLTDERLKNISTQTLGNDDTPIYVIDDFLSSDECDLIINEHKNRLSPSTLTRYDQNDPEFRTSKTGHFYNTDIQNRVNNKIKSYIVDEKNEEPQIQMYSPGDQFKDHFDAFYKIADKSFFDEGQRSWTFMIYLSDVEEGGETEFKNLKIKINPKKGRAVAWYNLTPEMEIDKNTLHAGRPVIKGQKWIITKWFKLNENP